MALTVLTNATILIAQADLSGYSNKIALGAEADELDGTTFGSSDWRTKRGGLKKVSMDVEGFWDAGDGRWPDGAFDELGVGALAATISPGDAAVGDVAYFTRVMRPKYSFGDQVGQLMPYTSNNVGDGTALVRGEIADNQARTVTGTTTVRTLTAPDAGQRVMAAIHILGVSGTAAPTLTATLQSDDAVGFPSPSTVVAGSALTAIGGQFLAGPYGATSDAYYRLSYVISGTNPSFTVVAAIGVGT